MGDKTNIFGIHGASLKLIFVRFVLLAKVKLVCFDKHKQTFYAYVQEFLSE